MENVLDKKFLSNFQKLSDAEKKSIISLIKTILSSKNEKYHIEDEKNFAQVEKKSKISQPKIKKSVLQLAKELIPDGKYLGLSSILEPYELGLE